MSTAINFNGMLRPKTQAVILRSPIVEHITMRKVVILVFNEFIKYRVNLDQGREWRGSGQ